jgi:hypothetical protein
MLFGNIVSLCHRIYELSRPHSRRNALLFLADNVSVDRRDFHKINFIALLELLRVLPSQNTHNHDSIRVNPVINRMTPVDAATISGADMVNSLPKPGVFGQFFKSLDQPVVIMVSPFLPLMKNAVFVQPA